MKFALVFFVACVAAVACAGEVNIEDLDMENMLKDESQWKEAYECLMDKGPCGGDWQKVRDMIPAVLETKCSQCTPKQKEMYDKFTKMVASKYPKQFEDLARKYSSQSE